MNKHQEPHPKAGQTVVLKNGDSFRLEDWNDRVFGKPWTDMTGNPACLQYAMRCGRERLPPFSNEVVYGKIGPFGHLIHVSEIKEE